VGRDVTQLDPHFLLVTHETLPRFLVAAFHQDKVAEKREPAVAETVLLVGQRLLADRDPLLRSVGALFLVSLRLEPRPLLRDRLPPVDVGRQPHHGVVVLREHRLERVALLLRCVRRQRRDPVSRHVQ
jgi:hypothetical protein